MHSQHHTPDLPHRDQHATQAQEPDINAYNTGKLRAVAHTLTIPSSPPVASHDPSGATGTARTATAPPCRVRVLSLEGQARPYIYASLPQEQTSAHAAVRAVCRAEDRMCAALAPTCATIRAQRSCVLVFSPSSRPEGHLTETQSAVSAAIALISRSAPGTARPATRAAVTSGGAPARASRGAIAP